MNRLVEILALSGLAALLACSPSPPAGGGELEGALLRLLPQAELSPELARDLTSFVGAKHGFTATGGSWRRHDDEVHETSSFGGAEQLALVRLTPEVADGSFAADVRLGGRGSRPATAGIVFRMRDERNGLGLALEKGVGLRLVSIRDGRARTLASHEADVESGRWYRVQASFVGKQVSASLDGRSLLDLTVPDCAPAGGMGFFRGAGEGVAVRRPAVGSPERLEPIGVDFAEVLPSIAPLVSSSRGRRRAPASEPWEVLVQTVKLDDDLRKSLIVPPDAEVRVPLTLPRRPVFHAEVGVLASLAGEAGGSSRLRIGFEDASRTRTWLWMQHVSAEAHLRSWEPVTFDLNGLEGTKGFLVFRNESIGANGSSIALANPLLRSASAVRPSKRRNLILVIVDTLRADHLGAYGYARDTSPFLDDLASRSVVFDDVTAQSSWTKTSMASLLTSTYPERNGVRGADHLLPLDLPTLAEALEQAGYFTAAVQTNPWLQPPFEISRGFAEYQSLKAAPPASRVNERAIGILNRRGDAPFFLYLHYMDTHYPYTPPAAYRRFGETPADAYDGEVRYLDDQLAGLYRSLDEQGLLDDTLLVVGSDHGEEFGEHGGRFHGGTLYDEQLRVPLILSSPHLPAGVRLAAPVQNLDVAPTLLELLDVPVPARFQGTSWKQRILAGEDAGDDGCGIFAQTGLNDVAPDRDLISVSIGRWKLIKDRRSSWSRLFDRSADPAERDDRSGARQEIGADLDRRCEEFFRANRDGRSPNEGAPIDAAVAEQLRALGYVTGSPAR